MNQELRSESQDDTLLPRIRAGSADAERELVTRYGRGVLLLLRARTHDADLAADLYQDTFAIVISKARANAIKNPDALQSFIHQVAVNRVLEHFRKARRRGELDAADPDETPLESPVPLPEEAAERALKLRAIRQAIAELPTDRDRAVLRRYYFDKDDRDTICNDLGLDEVHFRRVLYRAVQRLRVAFSKNSGGG